MTLSLADARRHLRIDGTQDDDEIAQKLAVADAMILAYVGHLRGDYADMTPSDEQALADERRMRHSESLDAARLMALGELWMNREGSCNPLSPGVKNILDLFREPGYA